MKYIYEFDISEMSDKHIKNCINCINDCNYKRYTKQDAKKDKNHRIFGAWWCYEHAEGYLEAFHSELAIRKRGRNQNYPEFHLEESCDNCKKHIICDVGIVCSNWELNIYNIFDEFSGEDLEVARRYGFYCNGIKYKLQK